MKKCLICGSECDDQAKFCFDCGNRFTGVGEYCFEEEAFAKEQAAADKKYCSAPGVVIENFYAHNGKYIGLSQKNEMIHVRQNPWGVAALVLGLLGLFLGLFTWLIPCVLAVIFGILGLFHVKKCGTGKGLSIAGLILGIVSVVLIFLFILFLINLCQTIDVPAIIDSVLETIYF